MQLRRLTLLDHRATLCRGCRPEGAAIPSLALLVNNSSPSYVLRSHCTVHQATEQFTPILVHAAILRTVLRVRQRLFMVGKTDM
jgi:hypothetical protein